MEADVLEEVGGPHNPEGFQALLSGEPLREGLVQELFWRIPKIKGPESVEGIEMRAAGILPFHRMDVEHTRLGFHLRNTWKTFLSPVDAAFGHGKRIL